MNRAGHCDSCSYGTGVPDMTTNWTDIEHYISDWKDLAGSNGVGGTLCQPLSNINLIQYRFWANLEPIPPRSTAPPPSPPPPSPPSPPPAVDCCLESCRYSSDGDCDDGGPGNDYSSCTLGSDCIDCGSRCPPPPPSAAPPPPPPLPPPPQSSSPPPSDCCLE